MVKGRRIRLNVIRIQNEKRDWIEDQEKMFEATMIFFKNSFLKREIMMIFQCLKNYLQ